MGNLSNLKRLILEQNELSGSVPSDLGGLSNLETLSAGVNDLSGNIPLELGTLSNLESLSLGCNQLSGSIPPDLGNLANLIHLDLASNQLSGNIPPELGNLANLTDLNLCVNQLNGGIPPELGNLGNLSFLNLSSNQLSGDIPPELGNLSNLGYLSLGFNQLSGSIPPELGNLAKLTDLSLYSNQLNGGMPPELGNLSNLGYLNLGFNQLSGSIPSDLGNLLSLEEMRLSSNALEGEVPAAIANLVNLNPHSGGHIDFGYNKLVASDPLAAAFLDEKDADWAETQTIPPTDVQAEAVSSRSVELTWTGIVYAGDGGHFKVSYATTPGGPYTLPGTTSDKLATTYVADGLSPSMTYYFVVQTFTPAHDWNQNDLLSWYSEEVSTTTLDETPTPTPTTAPTQTPTPLPTPTATPSPVVVCQGCAPGDLIYHIGASSFRGYATDSASDSPLIHVTSPPAPVGWNDPGFVPDESWQPGSVVWWDTWSDPRWGALIQGVDPIGLAHQDGKPEGVDGTTHLYRRVFTLSPPEVGRQISSAVLEMWSDNKTEWWWEVESIAYDREAYIGEVDLYPEHVRPEGGTYSLAVQNSNDFMLVENPQGTAFRLCVTWTWSGQEIHRIALPLVMKGQR